MEPSGSQDLQVKRETVGATPTPTVLNRAIPRQRTARNEQQPSAIERARPERHTAAATMPLQTNWS